MVEAVVSDTLGDTAPAAASRAPVTEGRLAGSRRTNCRASHAKAHAST